MNSKEPNLRTENSVAFASGGNSRGHVDAPFGPVSGKLNGDSVATGTFGIGAAPVTLLRLLAPDFPVGLSAANEGSSGMVPSWDFPLGSSWQRCPISRLILWRNAN